MSIKYVPKLLCCLALFTPSQAFIPPQRDHAVNDYYVLHLDRSASPKSIANHLGLFHDGPLGDLNDHHVFRSAKVDHDVVEAKLRDHEAKRQHNTDNLHPLDGVLLARKQTPKDRLIKRLVASTLPERTLQSRQDTTNSAVQARTQLMSTLNITDPTFVNQWHLFNTNQVGNDINVTGVWTQGITGTNTTVAVLDDGLDMTSDDLRPNYYSQGSWDFVDGDASPAPVLSDDTHGTRCAGEISAARNDACGLGVAYDSRISGIRMIGKALSDAEEAETLMFRPQENNIYSCSWGPTDDGQTMEGPGVLTRRAILQTTQQGRNGRGSIYVFSSGNGAAAGDNCNFDGYTNSIYTISVGAVDRADNVPFYSEGCSALLVVAYSSGGGSAIHTTAVGKNSCATNHGGTSASAPLAAGIFVLVLQIRPDLTWRDMQYLAIDTAVQVQGQTGLQRTALGKQFSHATGYGKLNAYAMVERAKTWQNVKPQAWMFSPSIVVNQSIPEGGDGLTSTFQVTKSMLASSNIGRLEHVTVTMSVRHTRRGDLSVDLISPDNIVSRLSVSRRLDSFAGGYRSWTFMSVAHWGESGIGNWTVIVRDNQTNTHQGTWLNWRLKLWGESIDANNATLLPMVDA